MDTKVKVDSQKVSAMDSTGDNFNVRGEAIEQIGITIIIFTCIIWLLANTTLPIDEAGKELIRNYCLLLIIGNIPAAIYRRTNATTAFILHWAFAVIVFGLVYVAFNTGGIYSPSLPILLVVPLIVASLLTMKAAIIWTIIIACIWAAFFALDNAGVIFKDITTKDSLASAYIASLFIALGMSMIGVWQFHRINQTLRQKLEEEHTTALYMASHDPLSKLFNRRKFEDTVMAYMATKQHASFCVVYLDLNGFKPINDNFGHEVGDVVLKEFSKKLKAQFRGDDVCARIGGDEFAVFIPGLSDKERAHRRVAELIQILSKPLTIKDNNHTISASYGIAQYPQDASTYDEIMAHADKSMYANKQIFKSSI